MLLGIIVEFLNPTKDSKILPAKILWICLPFRGICRWSQRHRYAMNVLPNMWKTPTIPILPNHKGES